MENKDENKRKRLICKILYIASKLIKIFLFVCAILMLLLTVLSPIVTTTFKNKGDNTIEIFNDEYEYHYDKEVLTLKYMEDDDEGKDIKIEVATSKERIDKFFSHETSFYVIVSLLLLGYLTIVVFIAAFIFKYLTKIFNNILNEKTPFTLENVNHLRKMGYVLCFDFVFSVIVCIVLACINTDLSLSISLSSLFLMLVLFLLSYIFKYGIKLQEDKEEKFYDDIK